MMGWMVVCLYVCMYYWWDGYICMHAYMHACTWCGIMAACMFLCMHACLYDVMVMCIFT